MPFGLYAPQILPGGRAVLVVSSPGGAQLRSESSIEVLSIPDRRRVTLLKGASFARYVPTSRGIGHLVYVTGSSLFAVAFDPMRMELLGTPAPILNGVGARSFDVARNGTIVYAGGTRFLASQGVTVQWLDSAGRTQPLLAKPGLYLRPRLSHDGQLLALLVQQATGLETAVYDFRRESLQPVTGSAAGGNANAIWSPDGALVFAGGESDSRLHWVRLDSSIGPQRLNEAKASSDQTPHSFSPDGRWLAYSVGSFAAGGDIWIVPVTRDGRALKAGQPEAFADNKAADERQAAFSPDGKWIAYASNESGTYQVWVMSFPDKSIKRQISTDFAAYPVWSPRGRELFFRSEDNRIMVAGYTATGTSFTADKPRVWSEKQLASVGTPGLTGSFDVARDGRVVALLPAETAATAEAPHHVTFVLNFFDELRRRAPIQRR
jgi:dipeptidyl aminopeptidase/acylaminoacyl peptidase